MLPFKSLKIHAFIRNPTPLATKHPTFKYHKQKVTAKTV